MRGTLLILLAHLLLPAHASAQGLFEEAMAGGGSDDQEEGQGDSVGAEAAGDGAGGVGLSATLSGIGFELSGRLRGALYVGKINGEDAAEVKAGYGEAALMLKARKGDWGDAYGEIRVRGGMMDGEAAVEPDLREGYINLYLGPVDLRVGHQVIIWGRADGVNPTNNLTPRDMKLRSPVEDDMRLANLALRAHLNLESLHLRWEVVWVPFFRATRLPSFQLAPSVFLSGMPVTVTLAPADYPEGDILNGTVATRVHLLLSAVEASISYLIGTSTMPGLTLHKAGLVGGAASATMGFTSYRHQVVGADFSTAIKTVGVRGEVAYRAPFGLETYPYVPRPEISYVLGLDRELLGQLSFILQYSGKAVLRWDDEPGYEVPESDMFKKMARPQVIATNQMIASQLEQYQHGVTFRAAWSTLHESLRLELMGTYNFSTEELMLRPKVTYDIADALTVVAGGEIYLGPDGSLYGMIEETQSAAYVELRASF